MYTIHVEGVQCTPSRNIGADWMADKQSVVITGVSTGIGWGITKVLVANGFMVFGSVRRRSDADRLQREFGEAFTPLIMDVTDRQARSEEHTSELQSHSDLV